MINTGANAYSKYNNASNAVGDLYNTVDIVLPVDYNDSTLVMCISSRNGDFGFLTIGISDSKLYNSDCIWLAHAFHEVKVYGVTEIYKYQYKLFINNRQYNTISICPFFPVNSITFSQNYTEKEKWTEDEVQVLTKNKDLI